jgi:hypothetical protein
MLGRGFAETMLPLDDPRWNDLNHRGWTGGQRYYMDSDAPYVPEELTKLIENPSDIERFQSLWPYLCSEGTTWAAAYAAVPYLVEIAKRLSPQQRWEHLYVVGLVVMCSCPDRGESFAIKPYLADSYRQALAEALPLLAETLVHRHDLTETRYLLAAIAALKGHPKLGAVLNDLDGICCKCPKCGEDFIYPEELQEASG